jgi:tetratricopeptide (TPR) repeat protein
VKSLWEEIPEETRESEALPDLTLEELYTPPRPPLEAIQWEEVWSVLTEPRQLGLGEGLATEMWLAKDFETETPPPPAQGAGSGKTRLEAAKHKLQTWATGETEDLLPALRFDGRRLDHFPQVREVSQKSRQALIDPYTELICEFKEVDPRSLSWERGRTGSYAFSSGANLTLGQWRLTEWNLRGAEAAFRSALKADSHDPEAWWHLGMAQLFRRKNRAAQKAFRQALDHRPNEARSQLGLGMAYYHERDYAKAEECFARIKGPDRRGTGARALLACCYRLQRKFPQALNEIHHLETSETPGWRAMGEQCRRCVARGKEKSGQKKTWKFWLTLIGSLALVLWWIGSEIYQEIANRPSGDRDWLDWGLALLIVLLWLGVGRSKIIEIFKQKYQEQEGVFGEGKESLPCWQTRAWMRPHKLDFFGKALPIPRK